MIVHRASSDLDPGMNYFTLTARPAPGFLAGIQRGCDGFSGFVFVISFFFSFTNSVREFVKAKNGRVQPMRFLHGAYLR